VSVNAASLEQDVKQAMGAGDFATAQSLLLQMIAADRTSVRAWLNLAAVRRQLRDADGAFAALEEVLRLEPRTFTALLMTATLLEREGRIRPAAAAYGAALSNAPPDKYLDPPTLQAVNHGREIHARHTSELNEFIHDQIADVRSQCDPTQRRRVEAFIGTTLRTRKRYQQEPLEYLYPGMPAIEFYDRAQFPWLEQFEAATPAIQEELVGIMREGDGGFTPYIHYEDHMPLDQWRELNHSLRWSAYHFFEKGLPVEEHCRRAPATLQELARLPQAHVPMRSPSALFSVLKPHTRIPAHTGIANFRLVVHLPLLVPPHCGFRVGGETREWRVGEAWVFDDTIDHEAWNESGETRVILICDVWSPYLSVEEREAIGQVIAATDAFNQTQATSQI
jgi:aspartate beta-hydroxylase